MDNGSLFSSFHGTLLTKWPNKTEDDSAANASDASTKTNQNFCETRHLILSSIDGQSTRSRKSIKRNKTFSPWPFASPYYTKTP